MKRKLSRAEKAGRDLGKANVEMAHLMYQHGGEFLERLKPRVP